MYFEKALSDFTFEMAAGGAVRHLADLGYSVAQIREKLDYPMPYERVQKNVIRYLCEKKILLLQEPETFEGKPIQWREEFFGGGEREGEDVGHFLRRKTEENGEAFSYMGLAFGIKGLDRRQQEYVEGLFQEKKQIYHRMDGRMREIGVRLYGKGQLNGSCYFLKTGEKVRFGRKGSDGNSNLVILQER